MSRFGVLGLVAAGVLVFACGDGSGVSGDGGGGFTSGTGEGAGHTATNSSSGALTPTSTGATASTSSGSGGCYPGLQAIDLTPDGATVPLDGVSAAPITFDAKGKFGGGATQTLDPTRLKWSVTRGDDTPPGTIDDGVLTPNPSAGGVVHVHATDGCVDGDTTVDFALDATLGDPGAPGDWDGVPVVDASAPTIVYPSDQTRFPRNIYRTLFQWRSQGYARFRMTFEGPSSTVVVYTDGADSRCAAAMPAAGCWQADEDAWSFIAGSNAGKTATWTVDALDTSTSPPTVRRSAPIEIGFSKQDVKGAIFYWSTGSAGVRRGRLSRQDPEDYIVGSPSTTYPAPDADSVKCVACHVVSRDGKYLVAPVDAQSGGSLWVTEVTADGPPTPLVKHVAGTQGHGFATISPDDEQVVAAWQGLMWSIDRATGNKLVDLPIAPMKATHPDWAPDGKHLVFANQDGDAPGKAALATLAFDAGAWGAPTILLAPPMGLSNLFPMYSPKSDWIAFSQGKGGHGDRTATLFLESAQGGAPVEMTNANTIVSNHGSTGQFENNQPTWAPPGDLDWVAFNSTREYGVVLKEGTQQIWIAAVDRSRAAQGLDPSYPAFRVEFQGLKENNHRAFWTLDIAEGGTGGGGGAGGAGAGGAGGAGGEGGTGGAPACKGPNQTCDPVLDCCGAGYLCDTNDDGATYICIAQIH